MMTAQWFNVLSQDTHWLLHGRNLQSWVCTISFLGLHPVLYSEETFVLWKLQVPVSAEKNNITSSFYSMTWHGSVYLAVWGGWVIQCQWNISDGALSIRSLSHFSSDFSHYSSPCARWLQKYRPKSFHLIYCEVNKWCDPPHQGLI